PRCSRRNSPKYNHAVSSEGSRRAVFGRLGAPLPPQFSAQPRALALRERSRSGAWRGRTRVAAVHSALCPAAAAIRAAAPAPAAVLGREGESLRSHGKSLAV